MSIAENIVRTYKIAIDAYCQLPPVSLLKKITSIELTNRYDTSIHKLLNTHVTHVKAFSFSVSFPLLDHEKVLFKAFLTQLLQVKRVHIFTYPLLPAAHDIVYMLPAYTHLKKLYISTLSAQDHEWDTVSHILPELKQLQVLHIQGSVPHQQEKFTVFTNALQTSTLLKRLYLGLIDIHANEAHALALSLRVLKCLKHVNMSKSIISQNGIDILQRDLMPYVQNLQLHAIPPNYH